MNKYYIADDNGVIHGEDYKTFAHADCALSDMIESWKKSGDAIPEGIEIIKTEYPVSYYDYQEIVDEIFKYRDDRFIPDLAEWFEKYGADFWNGEYYIIDEHRRLYPIYGDEDENGCYPITGYEIR